MTNEAKAKLAQLEQGLEQLMMQKKQFQQQLLEVESSRAALQTSKSSFKVIGNLMVERPSDELKQELSEKEEMLKVRLSSVEKQEDKLREQVKDAQAAVLEEVDKEK